MDAEANPYATQDKSATELEDEKKMARNALLPIALSIIVISILHIFGGLMYFVYCYGVLSDSEADPERGSAMVMSCMYYGVTMVYAALLIFGAFSMMRQGSYMWAMTACILAMVPFMGPCYLLAIPVGLMGVIVLRRPEVRDSFARM